MELNEKLARWLGLKVVLKDTPTGKPEMWRPSGEEGEYINCGWIDFTDSLDACFKWLVPKLMGINAGLLLEWSDTSVGDNGYVQISNAFKPWDTYESYPFHKQFGDVTFESSGATLALAFCKAIEKLMDKGVFDGDNI